MKPRSYPDELRAKVMALVQSGTSIRRAADSFGVPESTVRKWRFEHINPVPVEVQAKADGDLLNKLEIVAHLTLSKIKTLLEESEYSLADASKLLNVTMDKILLLQGRPNAIVQEDTRLTIEMRAKELEREYDGQILRLLSSESFAGIDGHSEPIHPSGTQPPPSGVPDSA